MPCKPVAICSSLLPSQKKKQREEAFANVVEPVRRSKENGVAALGRGGRGFSAEGLSPKRASSSSALSATDQKIKPVRRSSSQVHREFLRATVGFGDGKTISFCDDLPSCEEAYGQFSAAYPRFSETRALDHLRLQEYSHLEEEELACLDYCGFGLFSHSQQEDISAEEEGFSSTFTLSEISANLWSHALFGSAPEGTMECAIQTRIMEFLNVPSSEYSMVFTVSRGATFKLLADAYPWSTNARLVTMYDYESESVGWMEQRAADCGAKIYRARYRWPSLRVCSTELKKELTTGHGKKMKPNPKNQQDPDLSMPSSSSSRATVATWLDRVSFQPHQQRKEGKKGLFVFPVQSRISGAKYTYQWMSLAQQNQWHVLLDASALGPKDMDSLGLSLFRPDFITTSFYKLFGGDPSGFGCLLIKNSVAQSIQDPTGVPVSGMVRVMPVLPHWVSSSSSASEDSERRDEMQMISSFSGPVPLVDELDFHTPTELDSSIGEDNYSSACEDNEFASVGGVGRSPVFSEDGTDNPFFLDVGPSPLGTASYGSVSEEGFSGPLREELTQSTIQESQRLSGRRDGPPPRSRIKGLCSGLLNRHTGRVGNSGDSADEDDASAFKDAVKDFAEERDKDFNGSKHVGFQGLEVIEQGKLLTNGSFMSKRHGVRHENGGSGEHVPAERWLLALKKMREEQHALGNGELGLSLQVKECERNGLSRKGEEIRHETEDEEYGDGRLSQGGLETIEEIEVEAECPKTLEHDQAKAMKEGSLEANCRRISVSEKSEQEASVRRDGAICRETEGGFRLLGCRNADPFSLGRVYSASPGEDSFLFRSINSGGRGFPSFERSFGSKSDEEQAEQEAMEEPQLLCRGLDHADLMGLNKTGIRLRYLINWLVGSLLTLRHPGSDFSLVKIYGPHVRYDRGASIAFNVFDRQGKVLHPDLIRMLADGDNISLGLGFLRNIHFRESCTELDVHVTGSWSKSAMAGPSRVEVVTAALGLLSDFRDVYKLWSFVARFLDPEFLASEVRHLQPSSSSKHGGLDL